MYESICVREKRFPLLIVFVLIKARSGDSSFIACGRTKIIGAKAHAQPLIQELWEL